MPISLTCPGCAAGFAVPDTLAGKWIKCKSCGTAVEVTAAAARPARAAPVKASPVRAVAADDSDSGDDFDAPPARGKAKAGGSKLPLVLAGLGAFLLVGGGAAGYLLLSGGKETPVVATTQPVAPAGVNSSPVPPADEPPASKPPAPAPKPAAAASTPTSAPADPPKGTEPAGVVAPLSPGAVKPPTPPATAVAAPTKTDIDQLTLGRCKQAAVYIECDDGRGSQGSGSGWFGLEENMVFTNAHVIAMKTPNSPKPKKLTIFVNPGTAQQREIPHNRIEILAVDRDMDLALLRIQNEAGLPPPLRVRPSGSLRDLEKLVVLGYPGGTDQAVAARNSKKPGITVNDTKVAALRNDDDGNLYTVQVSGGIFPGNSGGALVDADGNVSGVAVRVYSRMGIQQIAYAVPTEYCTGLLAGRAGEVQFGVPYKQGGKVHFPVTLQCLDPLNRLKAVGLACWVGEESTKTRPAGAKKPDSEPGDSDYVEVPLKFGPKDRQVAEGELVLPEATAGRTYYAQPFYSNQSVERYWTAGAKIKLTSSPVSRDAVALEAKFKPGTMRPLTLVNKNSLIEFAEGEGADKDERLSRVTTVKGREVQLTPPAASDYGATLRMRFESMTMTAEAGVVKLTEQQVLPLDIRKFFATGVKQCFGSAWLRKTGEVDRVAADVLQVQPANVQPIFKQFIVDPVMDALMAASVRLPNKRVEPGETWKQTKQLRMAIFTDPNEDRKKPKDDDDTSAQRGGPPAKKGELKVREYRYQEEITYKYVGTRTRQGVKEAVLEVTGTISKAPGSTDASGASGKVKGVAFLDLDTGTVLKADVDREFEVDTSADGIKRRLSGVNTYSIDRGTAVAGGS